MGRSYQTSEPQFIQDIIYQPPWQLMQQVLATKQQGFDNAVASTELFKNLLDIKHLNFEDDRAREVKDYWNTQIDNVTKQLKANPNDYNKYMSNIRDLGRQLELDRKEGNIAKLEGRYNAWQTWQKNNEDLLKGNSKEGIQADPVNYNRLAQYWYNDIKNRASSDMNAQFLGQRAIAKPDMNSKEIREALKEFKANSFEKSNGMYKIGSEYVSESEAEKAFMNLYMSNPNAKSYLQQQLMIQDPEYYDSMTGQARELITKDSDGNSIINPQHGFAAGINAWGDILSFNKQKLEEDKYGLATQDYKHKSALQSQQDSAAMARTQYSANAAFQRDRANWSDRMNYMMQEYQLKSGDNQKKELAKLQIEAAKGDPDAIKALQEIQLESISKNIKNPTIDYTQNLGMLRSGDRAAGDREAKARDYARKELGGDADTKAFYQHYDALKRKGKSDSEIIESFIKARGVGSFNDVTGYSGYGNSAGIPGIGSSTTVTTAKQFRENQLGKLLSNYEEKKKEWFDNKYSKSTVEKEFYPLNDSGQNLMLGLYNSNRASWKVVGSDGKDVDPKQTNIRKIQRATDGSGLGMLAYQGIDDKGNQVIMVPNPTGYATLNAATTITLENLKDPNSYLRKSLTDSDTRRLTEQINSTGALTDGSKSVVFKSSKGDIPIKSSNGIIYIIDPETNRPIKGQDGKPLQFDSEAKVAEFLH